MLIHGKTETDDFGKLMELQDALYLEGGSSLVISS